MRGVDAHDIWWWFALLFICILLWPVVAWVSRCAAYVCCMHNSDENTATEVHLSRIRHDALHDNRMEVISIEECEKYR